MDAQDLNQAVEDALRPVLGRFGLESVSVLAGQDHDGDEALFVTARHAPGSTVPPGAVLSQALVAVQAVMRRHGDKRFAYVDYRFGEGEGYDEDDDPSAAF